VDERLIQARERYEQAVFGGDATGMVEAHRALDGVEADLALARGRLLHAAVLSRAEAAAEDRSRERPLFARAAELYQALDDPRGEAEAQLWLGVYHQVVADDHASAAPHLDRALDLARQADDATTTAYVLRHLGIAAHRAGRLAEARDRLQESTRLRRSQQFWPGVAANLVGLAYLAAAESRPADARALLEEAEALAGTSGAHRVLTSVREAQAVLVGPAAGR
jgi:tetratricopeptide (TPR) repeat protein